MYDMSNVSNIKPKTDNIKSEKKDIKSTNWLIINTQSTPVHNSHTLQDIDFASHSIFNIEKKEWTCALCKEIAPEYIQILADIVGLNAKEFRRDRIMKIIRKQFLGVDNWNLLHYDHINYK